MLACLQIEEFEAEAEAAATAKKGKKAPPRVAHMEESIARHRQHIMRLEQILRLLDNDAVQGALHGRGGGAGAAPRPATPSSNRDGGCTQASHRLAFRPPPLPAPTRLPHPTPPRPPSCPRRAAEEVEGVKDLVEDYMERSQDDWEEFGAPDDL
jgi:hypothetical protein